MYMLFQTHLETPAQANPSLLEHHRNLLRHSKLDPKKPEYNKAKELVFHSLVAHVLDCTRLVLHKDSVSNLKDWLPSCPDFDAVVDRVVMQYTTTSAAQDALDSGDELLAHSILFMRDSLFFWEFCDAIRDADVGRMWIVYNFWVFMMRGAGCHNYGNEILEMKAQFQHEFPDLLCEIVKHTWLINCWGRRGRSIPTDLYLEHNNGFTKNMFAALGSCASILHIQEKSSACVEVLRKLACEVSGWFGVSDFNRGHTEVSINSDIAALCVDIKVQKLHTFTSNRQVTRVAPKPSTRTQKKKAPACPMRDVLLEGAAGTDLYGSDPEAGFGEAVSLEVDDLEVVEAFADPNGVLEVDSGVDPEFQQECPFSNVDI
ncbi:unnamed protein product [Cyclocybe aegerita]|uniref:DUF6589 domain-containing protein n=1 Tax=Cyclocybe aegerita TaxID=1973307 RepID=A0A8S0VVK8_CYCAE|nr:unnamed protein product [Cyclocybe aegerita]